MKPSSLPVTLIKPDHLFDQAEGLIGPAGGGAPRQTDLRRSVSNSYYGLFHAILTAAADEMIGVKLRNTPPWALCYRSVTHTWLSDVCVEVPKPAMAPRFQPFRPAGGFGDAITGVTVAFLDLQAKRYRADYDPLASMARSDAAVALATARSAVRSLGRAEAGTRKAFLALVLFPPRRA